MALPPGLLDPSIVDFCVRSLPRLREVIERGDPTPPSFARPPSPFRGGLSLLGPDVSLPDAAPVLFILPAQKGAEFRTAHADAGEALDGELGGDFGSIQRRAKPVREFGNLFRRGLGGRIKSVPEVRIEIGKTE